MKQNLANILLVVGASVMLALSIRGVPGNPNAESLNTPKWNKVGPFELSPERGRFALTYSLIEDKSFNFSLDLARFVTPDLGYHNGKYVSLFAPAISYLIIPGYLVGKIFNNSQVGAFAVITIFALLNAVIIFRISKKFNSSTIASSISAGLFLFATPAYAYGVNLYQHHVSTFLVLLSFYMAAFHKNLISLAIVWFLCAMAIPVDYPNLFFMIPIGLFAIGQIIEVQAGFKNYINIDLKKLLSFLGVITPIAFFLWFNNASYGNPYQFSGTVKRVQNIAENGLPVEDMINKEEILESAENKEQKSAVGFFEPRSLPSGLYTLILSPDRGVIAFSPVLLIGLLGLTILYKKQKKEVIVLIGVITMNVLLYGMWGDPWGGWAFGSRYLIPSYAILAIFIASALTKFKSNMVILFIILLLGGYSIYVNTAGALSTSANPPQIQVLELEKVSNRRERFSWDRNIEYLQRSTSKSFVYQVWVKKYVSAWIYFQIISSILISTYALSMILLYLNKKEIES